MIRNLLFTAIVLGTAVVVMSALPDLARYLKMREM
jgi:hypothetical protein